MITAPRRSLLQRSAFERDRIAELIADRLDRPLTVAGILFALIVLADTTVQMGDGIRAAFDVVGWVLWLLFLFEFVARLMIAPSTTGFLRKNWWQLIFLAVPFLRFLRPLARLRIPRIGRIVSSAVRTSRAATRRLSGRLAWLAAVTLIVVVAASQLAYVLGDYDAYADALYDVALAAITGEATRQDVAAMRLLDVVLALFSVIVFAGLAGSLGAYFLERRGDEVHTRAQGADKRS